MTTVRKKAYVNLDATVLPIDRTAARITAVVRAVVALELAT
ncbi:MULTISPECIES: hypothetical protein [unclassified Streptomyces]|nr:MULTISPECIES: hypothetical protein [unclassified Streptomyces]